MTIKLIFGWLDVCDCITSLVCQAKIRIQRLNKSGSLSSLVFFQNSLFIVFDSLLCAVSVNSDKILSPKFFRCFSGITPAFGTE